MAVEMRDLERLQERESEDPRFRLGALLMALLTVVAATFALGSIVQRTRRAAPLSALDPLADLKDVVAVKESAAAETEPLEVDAQQLIFPTALDPGSNEPPELIATARAAAEEEARLRMLSAPIGLGAALAEPQTTSAVAVAGRSASGASRKRADAGRAARAPKPARAPRQTERATLAPAGREGEFTLQVISYESQEQARAFAAGLRARGHTAFVAHAQVPARGSYWRVRIGPFDSRRAADEYRRSFEQREHMNTFVVRRPRKTRLARAQ